MIRWRKKDKNTKTWQQFTDRFGEVAQRRHEIPREIRKVDVTGGGQGVGEEREEDPLVKGRHVGELARLANYLVDGPRDVHPLRVVLRSLVQLRDPQHEFCEQI
jgi:hypothetical protein